MTFWELTVPTSPDTTDGFTNFLWEQGALGVVEEESPREPARLRAFFPESAAALDLLRAVADYRQSLSSLGFAVAPETMALMRTMVENGEAGALVPERVWQEFSRGLMERDPSRMFPVLADAGFLGELLPELGLEFEQSTPATDAARILVRALACGATQGLGLAPRFALVVSVGGSLETARALSERLKVPGDCRDLALLAARHLDTIERAASLGAAALLALLEACDAFRRPERFAELLAVAECLEYAKRGRAETPYRSGAILRRALAAAAGVDAARIAAQSASGEIPAELRRARIAAIATPV